MGNRLQDEQSPYLLQHKDNPVDWYPWGEDAFERARELDRPIFLSIGYATCHWCHVMEHESFEDDEVARLMNETFVSIKVDREERPDVDNLYMTVCQMMSGRGGWPLNVLLTPDRKPFHAMTYVPRESRGGRPGMLDFVPRIKQLWKERREDLEQSAHKITGALKEEAASSVSGSMDEDVLEDAAERLTRRYDRVHGGFGSSPKFPSPHDYLFLLRHWKRTGDARWLEMVTHTLSTIRESGIFDQVGFGVHRYSTDQEWKLPHFEKMLYDQAMLLWTYAEAFQVTRNPLFSQAADELVTYVARDLRGDHGGFLCAEDADSEGEEGLFYQWTISEIEDILTDQESRLVVELYGMTEEGNFLDEATRDRTGRNVLHPVKNVAELAEQVDEAESEVRDLLERARQKLFAAREKRERPLLDDKALTDWNGLMILALARAGAAFPNDRYVQLALEAAEFVDEHLRPEKDQLLHRYRDGDAAITGKLDDYAFFGLGCSYLYEATFDSYWLETSIQLAESMIAQFEDDETGGFFLASEKEEDILVRQKSLHDGAIPSGNALAVLLLLRLYHITGESIWAQHAEKSMAFIGGRITEHPEQHTAHLMALDMYLGPAKELVLVSDAERVSIDPFLNVWRKHYEPNAVLLWRAMGADAALQELAPPVKYREPVDEKPAAYLCEDFTCKQPVQSAEALQKLMTE